MRTFRMCIIGIGIEALTAKRPGIVGKGEVESPFFSRPIVNKKTADDETEEGETGHESWYNHPVL